MASQWFWDRWLLVVAWILVVFGLLFALFNQSWPLDLIFNQRINSAFWPGGLAIDNIESFQAWIYGVLGATLSGWAVFLVFMVRHPFKRREGWAWNCIFAGITLWFVVDTAISAYFGVVINVVLNVALAASVYLPLFATRRQFI
jgi:hypothetical protein